MVATSAETLSPAISDDVEHLAIEVLQRACANDLSLVTAESCTGGLLSSLLTDVEGASHVFDCGFVVYSEEAKCALLGVARDTLDRCSAVSREVAAEMAEGAIAHSQANIALAVTGFAGPGAPGDEPGLVHFACFRRGGQSWHREEHFGDIGRGPVRHACIRIALEMIGTALDAV